ncbi:MAG TPA: SDR family NAD(P)-dependent oxidoreductase, partial [Steroidobacteraceae bacterium]|nr:SDR family NAD(P)-dependent oxidoreductase [Steroidobacteraceae bacterium]
MDNLFSLRDKVALVTGASSGLGAHFAAVLARAGARVILSARREPELDEVADTLRRSGAEVCIARMDVRHVDEVTGTLERVSRQFGPVDVLVNNSGVASDKTAIELAESQWDTILETNLKGAFLVSRECAKKMRDRKQGGSIVNIASILALR